MQLFIYTYTWPLVCGMSIHKNEREHHEYVYCKQAACMNIEYRFIMYTSAIVISNSSVSDGFFDNVVNVLNRGDRIYPSQPYTNDCLLDVYKHGYWMVK